MPAKIRHPWNMLAGKLMRRSRAFGRALLGFAIPPSCPACGAAVFEERALCAPCWRNLHFITAPYCAVNGTPFAYDLRDNSLEGNIVSGPAIAYPPPFEKARAAVLYGKVARRLVGRLKYEDRPDLAPLMAGWMMRALADLIKDSPVVAPVPLHYWRLLERRYNQSALLAKLIAHKACLEYQPRALLRVRHTRPQVGLTRKQREDNVRGVFKVSELGLMRISGRAVLLVDDVVTSGATASAASRACLRAGAKSVRVLSFARVSGSESEIAEDLWEEK